MAVTGSHNYAEHSAVMFAPALYGCNMLLVFLQGRNEI